MSLDQIINLVIWRTLSQTSGSYVSLGPVSNKNILQSNPSETSLSSTEKKASLVWVRRSPEAKEYKLLVKEYQQKVKNSQDLMVMAKKEKKRIKLEKTYKLLDQCKLHQGPVSPDNLDILDDLDEKQIMLEIRYLRITTCPNIRERFKLPSGKFQKLSQEELKAQIVNSLKPKPSEKNDLDQLFANLEECLKFFFFFVFSSCFCLLTIQSINNNIIWSMHCKKTKICSFIIEGEPPPPPSIHYYYVGKEFVMGRGTNREEEL